jgi:hypothetical protein
VQPRIAAAVKAEQYKEAKVRGGKGEHVETAEE